MYKFSGRLYLARVPEIATYSREELKMFGTPSNYLDGKLDKGSTFSNMTTVMINIETMVEYYSNGYPISVINHEDVNSIYKELEEYLKSTNPLYFNSIHKVKRDELKIDEIDKFAEEIFNINRQTIISNIIGEHNSAMDIGFTPMSIGGPQTHHTIQDNNTRTSILSRYDVVPDVAPVAPTTYLTEYSPEIDFDKIKRTSPRGFTLQNE